MDGCLFFLEFFFALLVVGVVGVVGVWEWWCFCWFVFVGLFVAVIVVGYLSERFSSCFFITHLFIQEI